MLRIKSHGVGFFGLLNDGGSINLVVRDVAIMRMTWTVWNLNYRSCSLDDVVAITARYRNMVVVRVTWAVRYFYVG